MNFEDMDSGRTNISNIETATLYYTRLWTIIGIHLVQWKGYCNSLNLYYILYLTDFDSVVLFVLHESISINKIVIMPTWAEAWWCHDCPLSTELDEHHPPGSSVQLQLHPGGGQQRSDGEHSGPGQPAAEDVLLSVLHELGEMVELYLSS